MILAFAARLVLTLVWTAHWHEVADGRAGAGLGQAPQEQRPLGEPQPMVACRQPARQFTFNSAAAR